MNRPEKTLVILTPGFAKTEADTACLPMQQSLVRALQKNDPSLHIVILAFQYPYFKKEYRWFDTTVISFNGQNKGGLPRLLLRRRLYKKLHEISRNGRMAGVLSFWYGECAVVGHLFAAQHGLKHYCWILGQDARKENNYPEKLKLPAHELLAVSGFIQIHFEQNHQVRPLHIVAPGTDPGLFYPRPALKDIDLLAVGSLISLKQYHVFIEVAAVLKKKLPALKAMLIGTGPEHPKLLRLVKHYGLEGNITLTGQLDYPEVLSQMKRAKILLHPSSYEGFSGVCLEALQAAAHVISFCRATHHETSQWHIVNSKEEMADQALLLLQDKTTVYQTVIYNTIDETARKMIDLFE